MLETAKADPSFFEAVLAKLPKGRIALVRGVDDGRGVLADYPAYALEVDGRGRLISKRRDDEQQTFKQAVVAQHGRAYYNAVRREVAKRLTAELMRANAAHITTAVETAPSLVEVYNNATVVDNAAQAAATTVAAKAPVVKHVTTGKYALTAPVLPAQTATTKAKPPVQAVKSAATPAPRKLGAANPAVAGTPRKLGAAKPPIDNAAVRPLPSVAPKPTIARGHELPTVDAGSQAIAFSRNTQDMHIAADTKPLPLADIVAASAIARGMGIADTGQSAQGSVQQGQKPSTISTAMLFVVGIGAVGAHIWSGRRKPLQSIKEHSALAALRAKASHAFDAVKTKKDDLFSTAKQAYHAVRDKKDNLVFAAQKAYYRRQRARDILRDTKPVAAPQIKPVVTPAVVESEAISMPAIAEPIVQPVIEAVRAPEAEVIAAAKPEAAKAVIVKLHPMHKHSLGRKLGAAGLLGLAAAATAVALANRPQGSGPQNYRKSKAQPV